MSRTHCTQKPVVYCQWRIFQFTLNADGFCYTFSVYLQLWMMFSLLFIAIIYTQYMFQPTWLSLDVQIGFTR